MNALGIYTSTYSNYFSPGNLLPIVKAQRAMYYFSLPNSQLEIRQIYWQHAMLTLCYWLCELTNK